MLLVRGSVRGGCRPWIGARGRGDRNRGSMRRRPGSNQFIRGRRGTAGRARPGCRRTGTNDPSRPGVGAGVRGSAGGRRPGPGRGRPRFPGSSRGATGSAARSPARAAQGRRRAVDHRATGRDVVAADIEAAPAPARVVEPAHEVIDQVGDRGVPHRLPAGAPRQRDAPSGPGSSTRRSHVRSPDDLARADDGRVRAAPLQGRIRPPSPADPRARRLRRAARGGRIDQPPKPPIPARHRTAGPAASGARARCLPTKPEDPMTSPFSTSLPSPGVAALAIPVEVG